LRGKVFDISALKTGQIQCLFFLIPLPHFWQR
jgi:hypothetical protein